jgi:hypothetical protein
LALVGFAAPIGQLVGVSPDNVHRAIGAAAVDDDILKVGVVCPRTERMVCSRKGDWLKDGVTMLIRGDVAGISRLESG